MNLKSDISSICSSASFALRNIGKIRKHLDRATTERLVRAFVTSRLDNCKSLLFGLPLYQIERLQRIQNTAASVMTLSSIKEHTTSILTIFTGLSYIIVSSQLRYYFLRIKFWTDSHQHISVNWFSRSRINGNCVPITNIFLGCPNQEQQLSVTEHSLYVLQSYGTIYQVTLNLHHR